MRFLLVVPWIAACGTAVGLEDAGRNGFADGSIADADAVSSAFDSGVDAPIDAGTFACGTQLCGHGTQFCRLESKGIMPLEGGAPKASCILLPLLCMACTCLPKGGPNCTCSVDADGNLTQTC